jgi:predicted permease
VNFLTSAASVFLLIVMAVPGYILRKARMIPEGFNHGVVTVLLYVSLPCLVTHSFATKAFEPRLLADMAAATLLSFAALLAGFGVSALCFAWAKDSGAKKACVAAGYMNNCAFMGIPVLQAIFPGDGEPVIYAALFGVGFNLLAWTLLVYSLTGDRQYINVRNALLNPQILTFAVALPIFFLRVNLPAPALTALKYVGDMTTPLSMILLGIKLADAGIKTLAGDGKLYLSAAVKLIFVPLAALAVLLAVRLVWPFGSVALTSLFLIMGMPAASTVVMFAEKYGADSETASKCVLISSILCVITIPMLTIIAAYL